MTPHFHTVFPLLGICVFGGLERDIQRVVNCLCARFNGTLIKTQADRTSVCHVLGST